MEREPAYSIRKGRLHMKSKTIINTVLIFALVFGGSTVYGAAKDSNALGNSDSRQLKEKFQLIKQLRDRRNRENGDKKLYKSALPIISETASLLGITKDDLLNELKEGKSMADVARSHGMNETDLISKLMTLRIQKVNEAVIAGKLSAEKAEKIKTRMKEHVQFLVTQKGNKVLEHTDSRKSMRQGTLRHFNPQKMAELIGIPEQDLIRQLEEGKSLTEIAESHGISKQELVSKIKSETEPLIDRLVETKQPENNK